MMNSTPLPTSRHLGNGGFILNVANNSNISSCHFDPIYWKNVGQLIDVAGGRGSVQFVTDGSVRWVIRTYMRGGLLAKLVKRRYLWCGLERTRPFKELHLLMHLDRLGLNAPRPIAALVSQNGMQYQAKLITEQIPAAKTLNACLQQGKLSTALWGRIGRTIAKFHCRGIFHADLNANNILLDHEARVYLIDFDKGQVRNPAPGWQVRNIDRLHRSLLKVSAHDENVRGVFLAGWRELKTQYGQALQSEKRPHGA